MKKITKQLLERLNVCQSGIDFFLDNKLNKLNYSKIKQFNGCGNEVSWFNKMKIISNTKNKTHFKNSNEYEWWVEYNEAGQETHYKDSSGYEWWAEYNEAGILIKKYTKDKILFEVVFK